jgi:phosphoadenosine phosphosulfate reductase
MKILTPDSAISEQFDIEAINALFETAHPLDIVNWAAAEFGDDLVMTSSFGAESALLLHMATQIRHDINVIMIDTGYLFPETHLFMEELRAKLNLNVWSFRTKNDPIQWLQTVGENDPTWRDDVDRCCAVNKNEPMERAMNQLKPKAWLRGIRRKQSSIREDRKFVEWSKRYKCFAVSPILNWGGRQISDYLRENDLPYHPLWEKGYLSIGCNPQSCTRSVGAGEHARSGRWSSQEKTECGLHLDESMDSANL